MRNLWIAVIALALALVGADAVIGPETGTYESQEGGDGLPPPCKGC